MRRGTVPAILILLALAAAPVLAKVKVQHDPEHDFSVHKTYAWKKGTVAGRPKYQERIVADIDRALQAAGLEKTETEADIYVISHTLGAGQASLWGSYFSKPGWYGGIIMSDATWSADGTMFVELQDTGEQAIWQAQATEKFNENLTDEKVFRRIDQVVEKMFRGFPPKKK